MGTDLTHPLGLAFDVVTGRPWPYTGDNPAPCMDAAGGNVSVLYRTDSHSGGHVSYQEASLIGMCV
mgnify:CR=1 FL=1